MSTDTARRAIQTPNKPPLDRPPLDTGTAVRRGLRARCPACGQGRLFASWLTVRPQCSVCGLSLATLDTGDGPAVFVILVVGAIIIPLMLWLELAANPPFWVHILLFAPLTLLLSLGLLRAFKGAMLALIHRHQAGDHREPGAGPQP